MKKNSKFVSNINKTLSESKESVESLVKDFLKINCPSGIRFTVSNDSNILTVKFSTVEPQDEKLLKKIGKELEKLCDLEDFSIDFKNGSAIMILVHNEIPKSIATKKVKGIMSENNSAAMGDPKNTKRIVRDVSVKEKGVSKKHNKELVVAASGDVFVVLSPEGKLEYSRIEEITRTGVEVDGKPEPMDVDDVMKDFGRELMDKIDKQLINKAVKLVRLNMEK